MQPTDKEPDERETSVPLPPPVPSSSTSPKKQDADRAHQDQGGREEEEGRRAAGGATKGDKCSEDQQEERWVNPNQVNPPKSMMKQIYVSVDADRCSSPPDWLEGRTISSRASRRRRRASENTWLSRSSRSES